MSFPHGGSSLHCKSHKRVTEKEQWVPDLLYNVEYVALSAQKKNKKIF